MPGIAHGVHRHAQSVRPLHRLLLLMCVLVLVWGAFAFGAVYPWAFVPLAIGCVVYGVLTLIVEWRGRPPVGALSIGLAAILAGIALQLVPLSMATLLRISPGTDAFLQQYDFSYQLQRSASTGTGFGDAAAPLQHPISIAPAKTVRGGYLFAALALFLLGTTRLASVVSARRICQWVIGIGGLLAIVGIVQRTFTADDLHPLIYGFWKPLNDAVPFGPFVNPNHFAGWMLMGLPVALAAFLDVLLRQFEEGADRKGNRIDLLNSPQAGALLLYGGACLLMGLSLLMTKSRSALVSFMVGVVIAGWGVFRRQSRGWSRLVVAGSVLAMLLASVGLAGVDTITAKFDEPQGPKSLNLRLGAWRDAAHIMRDFPYAGSGFDTYGTAMMVYQTTNRRLHFQEAHNDFVQLAAEGGLLIGIPILATLGVFVRDVRRRFREAPRTGTTYYLRLGAVVGMLSVALQSLLEFSLQMPGNAALFAVLAAIALHQSPNLRRAVDGAPANSLASVGR
jgi:O-Antigen ligase